MTATIIPFPAPETRRTRLAAVEGAPAAEVMAFLPPLLPSDAGQSGTPGLSFVREPARAQVGLSRNEATGAAPAPEGTVAYSGPCRRIRGLRSMTVMPAVSGSRPMPAAPEQSERLARSLENLRAALAQQATAVAAWRASLGELDGAVRSLKNGFARQTDVMQDLGEKVSQLGTAAGTLEQSVSR